MKSKKITTALFVLMSSFAALQSCRKADADIAYGSSKIYMPQAILKSGGVDNNFPVPSGVDSSTLNYVVDKANDKVNVLLGASLSGPASGAYSVDISVNNDTVQQLIANGTFNPATYMVMPASVYTLPTKLDVAAGKRSASFSLSMSIEQLKLPIYAGKFLVAAVKISNPSQYELNNALSTTVVILDVNKLVIGPSVNVTAQYILNPGAPFKSDGFMSGSTRWGNLKDWKTNEAARSHGGFGGFSSDGGGTMNMESGWGSPKILNGKIYQTITLPAGSYSFDLAGGSWAGGENFMKDIGYSVVALGADELPDYSNIVGNTAILYQPFVKTNMPAINFELDVETKLTVGTVVNYASDEQGFKTKQVILLSYPNHL